MRGGAKCRVLTSSLSPQGRAYSRALKSKKSSQLKNWCIMLYYSAFLHPIISPIMISAVEWEVKHQIQPNNIFLWEVNS